MIALAREADTTWMTAAACRGHDTNMWFPDAGKATSLAVAICLRCPVRERCADYADAHRERHGLWGGMTTEERNRRARGKVMQRG